MRRIALPEEGEGEEEEVGPTTRETTLDDIGRLPGCTHEGPCSSHGQEDPGDWSEDTRKRDDEKATNEHDGEALPDTTSHT